MPDILLRAVGDRSSARVRRAGDALLKDGRLRPSSAAGSRGAKIIDVKDAGWCRAYRPARAPARARQEYKENIETGTAARQRAALPP